MKAIRSLELPVKSLRLPGLDELYTEEIEDRLVNIDDQRLFVVAEPCAGASRRRRSTRSPSTTCGSSTASRTLWIWRTPWITDIWTATPCAGPRRWLLRRMDRRPLRPGAEGDQGPAGVLRHPPGLQDGGHLRRRVRGPDPLLLLHLRPGERGRRGQPGDDGAEKRKVLVLGSGPIRIGQGIEFDYCSVHSVWASSVWAMRPSSSTTTRRPCPPTSMWRISSTLSR